MDHLHTSHRLLLLLLFLFFPRGVFIQFFFHRQSRARGPLVHPMLRRQNKPRHFFQQRIIAQIAPISNKKNGFPQIFQLFAQIRQRMCQEERERLEKQKSI